MTVMTLPPDFEVDSDCSSTRSHGTRNAYRRNKCRCPEAVFATRVANINKYRNARIKAGKPYRPRSWTPDREIDELAVQDAVNGHRTTGLSKRERRLVVAALTARGMSAQQISEYMDMSVRTVVRHRRDAREMQS